MNSYEEIPETNSINRPLFGVSTRRERLCNLVIGAVTSVFVVSTFISAFLPYKEVSGGRIINIIFALCIAFICASLLVLIHWYRQGDLDPKFRKMIYYNSIMIILLCVCANLYFHCPKGSLQKCH